MFNKIVKTPNNIFRGDLLSIMPFGIIKGFKESKFPMADSLSVPPMGALGLVYSKCVNPALYLGAPCIAIEGDFTISA